MKQLDLFEKIIVDNFAGGGGASTGIELACGRPVTIAINHDPDAILLHRTNHPYTEHLQASVWDVDPEQVVRGRKVGLAWFSPDCKHFSKAKGSALVIPIGTITSGETARKGKSPTIGHLSLRHPRGVMIRQRTNGICTCSAKSSRI